MRSLRSLLAGILLVAGLSFAAVPSTSYALDCTAPPDQGTPACNPQNQNDPCINPEVAKSALCKNIGDPSNPVSGNNGILTRATQFIAYLVGITSIIAIIIGAIRFSASSGDANAISAAKKTILYALIGVVVAIFAQALVVLVLK